MFLFRSLTLGLLGACVLMLARGDRISHTTLVMPSLPAPQHVSSSATIVDVAPGIRGADVTALIRLWPNERVVAVDDRAVGSDTAAGAAISKRAPGAGGFVDLDIASDAGGHRRILVLMH